MPIVDYNRMYQVRARERQAPKVSPGIIPNIAGAYISANAPGINAKMGIARDETAYRTDRIKGKYRAAMHLVNATADVAVAYSKAVDRRNKAELDEANAIYGQHLASNAREALETERRPPSAETGDEGDGPIAAVERLDKAFNETDAYKRLRPAVREAFNRDRAFRIQPLKDKAADEQTLQMRRQREKNLKLDLQTYASLAETLAQTSAPNNTLAWEKQVDIAVAAAVAQERFALGIDTVSDVGGSQQRREPSPQEALHLAQMQTAMREAYHSRLVEGWIKQVANDPEPTDKKHPLEEGIVKYIAGDDDLPEASKADLMFSLQQARQQRERNVERLDTETQKRLVDAVAAITLDPAANPDPAAAFNAAREKANSISSAALRAKVLDGIDKAEADIQFSGFLDAVDAAAPGEELPRTDVFLGENSEWFASAMQEAESLPSPDARDRAVSWLLSGRATVEKAENQAAEEQAQRQASELLSQVLTGYGYNAEGTPVSLTVAERASAFRALYPRLTPQQRREYGEAIRKTAISGAAVSLADIDEIGRAAGVENLSAFFAPPQPGKDPSLDKEKLRKDGTVTIDPAGLGNKFAMPADAMMEMVEAIRQYKAAVAAAGNKAGVRDPAQIWASVLADKSAYKGYCEAAHRSAVSQALAEYAAAYPAALMPPSEDEQR